jgi:hypothetical protein
MPECSKPNIATVRPKPVGISSAMSTIPWRSVIARMACMKALGGGRKPPWPCTASMMIAATRSGTICVAKTSSSVAIAISVVTPR